MSEKTFHSNTSQKEISIFRTSFSDTNEIKQVHSILDLLIGKNQWNFDLEDIDKILRIHAEIYVNAFLIQELKKLGYQCEELF